MQHPVINIQETIGKRVGHILASIRRGRCGDRRWAPRVQKDTGREVAGVADLTSGEYLRLIEQDKYWKKLKLEIDRVEFVKRLEKIRDIRNDVMHFDPAGLEAEDLATLREFAQLQDVASKLK